MFIRRKHYEELVSTWLRPGKVLFLIGPRRAGKTTFLKYIRKLPRFKEYSIKFINGESLNVQRIFSKPDEKILRTYLKGVDLLLIDEVHGVPDVGKTLKFIVDTFHNLSVIATGSASLELLYKVGEPLVGRKFTLHFFPFSIIELVSEYDIDDVLDELLVYGLYPEVFLAKDTKEKQKLLKELVDSYLLKDILMLTNIRYKGLLLDLLKLLAYQIGQVVSYNELANELSVSVHTVKEYISLLEEAFVIVRLPGFSRNMRNEIKKSKKFYFVDLGIRNAVIEDFSEINLRPDKGRIWENFMVVERMKYYTLKDESVNFYFWRTKYGHEVDLIEEFIDSSAPGGKRQKAYEFKYTSLKLKRKNLKILEYYPQLGNISLINRYNWKEFFTF